MNRKRLFKELNELCLDMDRYYNINNGGCCFVAACLAEQFEKYNIPYTACVTYSPTHYCIKVNDRFINRCDYVFKESDFEEEFDSNILYTIYKNEDWNKCYNRKWNLIVKTRITSVFKRNGNT